MPPSRSTTAAHASSSSSPPPSDVPPPPDRPILTPLTVTGPPSHSIEIHSPSVLLAESSSSSAGPVAASTSTQIGVSAGGSAGTAPDDIEMEPIQGHRRRKSSLMQPIGHNPASLGRPRASSQLNSPVHGHAPATGSLLGEEPKFSDEGSYSRSVSPRRDQSDFENFSDDDVRDDEETGLTTKEKKKRQKKRRRNTLLDQRIAREKNLSADQKRDVDKSIVRRIAINIGLVLLWYFFSLCISLVWASLCPLNPFYMVSQLTLTTV